MRNCFPSKLNDLIIINSIWKFVPSLHHSLSLPPSFPSCSPPSFFPSFPFSPSLPLPLLFLSSPSSFPFVLFPLFFLLTIFSPLFLFFPIFLFLLPLYFISYLMVFKVYSWLCTQWSLLVGLEGSYVVMVLELDQQHEKQVLPTVLCFWSMKRPPDCSHQYVFFETFLLVKDSIPCGLISFTRWVIIRLYIFQLYICISSLEKIYSTLLSIFI